jgi:hypothetical protein
MKHNPALLSVHHCLARGQEGRFRGVSRQRLSREINKLKTHNRRRGLIVLIVLEDATHQVCFLTLLIDVKTLPPLRALEGHFRLSTALHQDDSAHPADKQSAE